METLGDRIKHLREKHNLKQAQLAELIGVKSGAVISNWEKNVNKPDVDKLISLCNTLNVSSAHLLNMPENNTKLFLSKDEMDLISKFRILDSYGRKTILTLVDLECNRMNEILGALSIQEKFETSKSKPDNLIKMKVYPQKASAGTGNYTFDDLGCEEITFNRDDVPEKADFGVYIKGDSMEPKISDGDIVWVSQRPSLENNEVGIFILNEESFCKKAVYNNGHLYLVSLNKKYSPIEVKEFDELNVIGKVLI